ncbi:MAG: ATP synthase F1 subunit gamma [Candidatus Pacebacteria bacterium]|nr:ATP synthase F1 subunit gamma [Candidatus Paceibacterota bacterium]
MAQTRQILARINTSKNIAQITKAMQMVAASKMQRAQDQAVKARAYAEALADSLQVLSRKIDPSLHPLLQHHEQGVDVAIVISTEKGLCGSLNTNLFKKAAQWREQHPEGKLVAIGKKAVHLAKSYGFDIWAQFTDLPDTISTEDVVAINTLVNKNFLEKEFKSVSLIYTDFINTLTQKTVIQPLLPLGIEQVETQFKQGVEGEAASPALSQKAGSDQPKKEYLFEPNAEAILKDILPLYLENTIFHAFLEAKASEHSARMVAMKSASENAQDLIGELQLQYNRSRQEEITNELLDQVTAIKALS